MKKKIMKKYITSIASAIILTSCATQKNDISMAKVEPEKYADFTLNTDASQLSKGDQKMLPYLFEVAKIMDELFWYEAYGKKEALLNYLKGDKEKFAVINYGPWDRLNNDAPFIKGIGAKPAGANFYPTNMTKEEFEAANLKDGKSLYTFVRRDMNGNLYTIPYHEMFPKEIERAAKLMEKAAQFAETKDFRTYLLKRAQALRTDDYYESDLAWMNMKDNHLDFIVGPIETYEDQLFGYKASHEAYILVKDQEWSKKLEKYAQFLPELQTNLPVANEYKAEKPGSDADLNAYDVIYYAGHSNAGSKTIAINLPNDERVQLEKGTRRLQLKNAMRAKFDKILKPISELLIDPKQRKNVTFDAFFANTMFHEVAHGLGIKNTINGKGSVRQSLKEHASALEEGKADILGLYMVNQLVNKKELEGDIKDYMTTFMAGIFRSVRFGASSAHGVANMIRFNYFKEKKAFTQNADGTYTLNYENLKTAMNDLSKEILTLQGNGDYNGVAALVEKYGKIPSGLQTDLDRLNQKGIPVDINFIQGLNVYKK
ncbi:Peptidase family M49 [Candidatus Ornithobacterium hominis]|nr:Peptidase family M49 [Candidatus Ornithobacterium hominis]